MREFALQKPTLLGKSRATKPGKAVWPFQRLQLTGVDGLSRTETERRFLEGLLRQGELAMVMAADIQNESLQIKKLHNNLNENPSASATPRQRHRAKVVRRHHTQLNTAPHSTPTNNTTNSVIDRGERAQMKRDRIV